MKISLVATVKDAGEHVAAFLQSVRAQGRPPDEVVIVDGGSIDGTRETLRSATDVTLIESPGANIARGRNMAIRAAAHDVIAVSDADCVLGPDWLAHLERALEDGADVAMGFYRPIARSFFEACAAAVSVRDEDEVDPDRFMPSSRSIAFRRESFERVGGYPEWLEIGEDMYLNHRFRELDARMEFVPRAVAYWRIRPTPAAMWRQYYRYAEGDGLGGMHPERHAIRLGVYGLLAGALLARRRGPLALLGAAGALYARRPLRRAFRLLPARPVERAAAVVAVPALMAVADAARMAGYLAGLRRRVAGRHPDDPVPRTDPAHPVAGGPLTRPSRRFSAPGELPPRAPR
ncbi:MAG TPA: glycosyltransferase [Actinomycetota bacterium]|nr:glycosyltransferase [Actinomycetota bacterium]